MPDYERILVTGAAGSLGSHLRRGLAPLATRLRLADIRELGDPLPHEELVRCDLSDKAAAMEAVRGCDAIVHFAGHPREQTFEEIVADTLPASYHVFEGARLHRLPAAWSMRARSTPSASTRWRRCPTRG